MPVTVVGLGFFLDRRFRSVEAIQSATQAQHFPLEAAPKPGECADRYAGIRESRMKPPGRRWIRSMNASAAAFADPNRSGKRAMAALIDSIRRGVPAGLEEIAQLGRTLWRRRTDILAFFDHHASNGPTEAINGRLEALRRNALGFRNLTHYRIRSLLHSGALHALVNAL